MNVWNVLRVLALGGLFLAIVLLAQGCTSTDIELAPSPAPQVITDYTAVAVMDCGQLKYIVFTSPSGKISPVRVEGPASLLDLTLRLSKVDYNRVFVFENDRACGFEVDETKLPTA